MSCMNVVACFVDAALDFIECGVSDMFAITDSGSNLSSLVYGFRMVEEMLLH